MEQRPPIWLIVLFALQVLFGLALLFLGVSVSGSHLRALDILGFAIPLLVFLAGSGLGWWLWISGRRKLAVGISILAPLLILFALFILLGVGI